MVEITFRFDNSGNRFKLATKQSTMFGSQEEVVLMLRAKKAVIDTLKHAENDDTLGGDEDVKLAMWDMQQKFDSKKEDLQEFATNDNLKAYLEELFRDKE